MHTRDNNDHRRYFKNAPTIHHFFLHISQPAMLGTTSSFEMSVLVIRATFFLV
jgi:hypothetical protein